MRSWVPLVVAALLLAVLSVEVPAAAGPAARVAAVTLRFRGTTDLGALAARSPSVAAAPRRPGVAGLPAFRTTEVRESTQAEPAPPRPSLAARAVAVESRHPEVLRSVDGLGVFDQKSANQGNQYALEPPDQGLCVGDGFVLETVNTVLQVRSDRGRPVSGPVDLHTFYRYPPELDGATHQTGPLMSDPSCLFDPDTGRWFHVAVTLQVNPPTGRPTGPSSLDLAVSRTSDPTGRWDLYAIAAQNDGTDGTPEHGCVGVGDTGTGPCMGDYPQLGLDRNALVIATNEYTLFGSTQFTGANLYVISKRRLAEGGTTVPAELLGPLAVPELGQPGFTVLPANGAPGDRSTARGGTMFFVSTTASPYELGGEGTSNAVVLWALSNTASLDTRTPALRLRHVVVRSQPYSVPLPAEQRPGDTPFQTCLNLDCFGIGAPPTPETLNELDPGDSRTGDATISRGTVIAVWDTAVNVGGRPQDGVAYTELHPSLGRGGLTATLGRHGILAASGENLLYPSIALNAEGRGYLGLSITGPGRFPSVAYAPYELGHRPSLIRVAAPGRGPDDGFTGTFLTASEDRARWGDYGAAVASPDGTIWIGAEYIAHSCSVLLYALDTTCGGTRSAAANWGTRIIQLDTQVARRSSTLAR